jgi:thiol-disulfide isomerase/thioredoxin
MTNSNEDLLFKEQEKVVLIDFRENNLATTYTYRDGSTLNNQLDKKTSKIFILFYMEGCGPCNATRPEWSKMAHTLQKQYSKNKDTVIIDINKNLLSSIKSIGSINGFPTISKYKNGKKIGEYEGERTLKNINKYVKL